MHSNDHNDAGGVATLPKRSVRWPVVGLATAFVGFNLLFSPTGSAPGSPQWLEFLLHGIIFSQSALLAVWAALGPGAGVYRIPLTFAALITLILAECYKGMNVLADPGAQNKFILQPIVIQAAIFVLVAAVFLLSRYFIGTRITHLDTSGSATPLMKNQFSLKYLLGIMTACAVVLAVSQAFEKEIAGGPQRPGVIVELTVSLAMLLLLLWPPTVLPFLALARRMWWSILGAVLISWGPCLWLAVTSVALLARNPPPQSEILTAFIMFQLGATLAGLSSALVLRSSGYRLIRHTGA